MGLKNKTKRPATTVVRTTITLPVALHRRLQDRPDINISAAAATMLGRLLDGDSVEEQLKRVKARNQQLYTALALIKDVTVKALGED